MTQFALTRKAAEAIYAAPCSIIVSEGWARYCRALAPSQVSIFSLHYGGLISTVNEDVSKANSIPLIGFPHGVLGLISSQSHKAIIEKLTAYIAEQKPTRLPSLLLVKGLKDLQRRKILQYVASLLADQLGVHQASLAQMQHQLAEMRGTNEQLWLGFEKARRMIVGMGLSTRSISFDLPVGEESIGQDEGRASLCYEQSLPMDIGNLSGLSLYVIETASRETAAKESGVLQVIVLRRSDRAVIGSVSAPYSVFTSGWHHFAFPQVTGRAFGDAILQLVWTGEGGPRFAFAASISDRFGNGEGQSLAMRVEQGLVEPLSLDAEPINERVFVTSNLSPRMLRQQGRFFGGAEAERNHSEQLGAPVLRLDDNGRWLETHMLKEGFAALKVPKGAGAGSQKISAQLTLDHPDSAPGLAILMAASSDAEADEIIGKLQSKSADGALSSSRTEGGSYWIAQPITAGRRQYLELNLDTPLESARDLVFGVLPMIQGFNQCGWCRWHDVQVAQQLSDADIIGCITDEDILVAQSRKAQMRVHRLPEMADQIAYYRGKQAHADLRDKLGFWPIEFSDDTGAMQLNPLSDDICAAVLEGGLPENTRKVACEIGTAHAHADTFTYIVAKYANDTDVKNAVELVERAIKGGEKAGAVKGIEWSSRTINALEKRRLELNLKTTSEQGAGLFLMVVPAENGQTSFGWCRWYMLSFEIAGFEGPVTLLEAAAAQGAAQ